MKRYNNVVILLIIAFGIVTGCTKTAEIFDFSQVKEGAIVTDPGFSQGAAWADFDNDGDEDLFVTNSWTNGNNLFYINNGDGTFIKEENIVIVNDGGNSNGCTWGDVDNDGDLDLFVANVNDQNNFFYKNNGDGTFLKDTLSRAATDKGWSYTAAWADFNNDGWLDLFVGNYNEQANFLYVNDGMGNLGRMKESVITEVLKSTQGCSWFDYNNDGKIDLFVANKEQNDLYENLGQGKFKKIVDKHPVKEVSNSFGSSAGDYNNDGFIDLFVATWWGKNHLYKNLGDGNFQKMSGSSITEEVLNSEGSSWGDFDNDGDLDLIVTNDGNNSLFENQEGNFTKLENLSPAMDSSNSNGVTWNDADNDGDLDIFIANGGNQPNLLYSNPGNKNNWLKVNCIGNKSNSSAIGAKVILFQSEKVQMREVTGQTGGGYGAQNGLILHFGLGEEKIDSINVLWPSGKIHKMNNPKINRVIRINEM